LFQLEARAEDFATRIFVATRLAFRRIVPAGPFHEQGASELTIGPGVSNSNCRRRAQSASACAAAGLGWFFSPVSAGMTLEQLQALTAPKLWLADAWQAPAPPAARAA